MSDDGKIFDVFYLKMIGITNHLLFYRGLGSAGWPTNIIISSGFARTQCDGRKQNKRQNVSVIFLRTVVQRIEPPNLMSATRIIGGRWSPAWCAVAPNPIYIIMYFEHIIIIADERILF